MLRAEIDQAVGLFEERYGLPGSGATPVQLRQLVRSFCHLPYENLSKILVSQQLQLRGPLVVMADHLELGTGGTCYSLTELLRRLAGACGLESYPVMAHMRHGVEVHCALRVSCGGRAYLVDPGYLLPRPLELGARDPGEPAAGSALVVLAGTLDGVPPGVPRGDFDLFTAEPAGLKWRYRFSDRAPTREQFLSRWRKSFQLPGMRSLVATRRDGEARLYLHNHKLRRQDPDHKSTTNVRAELEATVRQSFGIAPAVTRRARALLAERKRLFREQQRGQ